MAKITKIEAQKNKKRINIYLDGKFAFGLGADEFLQSGLKIGQDLTEKQIDDLVLKNEFQRLLNRAIRLISFRPRSEKEIHDYLRKFLNQTTIDGSKREILKNVIEKLRRIGFLNDEQFTRWWIEQRISFRPRGKLALIAELKQKGVNDEIIREAIEEKIDEFSLAKELAKKRLKAYKDLPKEEQFRKMTAFLKRRGFSWETIKKVFDKINLFFGDARQ